MLKKRTHQLDFIRGLFLVIILVVHFLSRDNILIKFTNEIVGWASAAEGFVFLSGLTAGLVYTSKFFEKGEGFIASLCKKRAWLIYRYHISLFVLAIVIMYSHDFMRSFWMNYYNLIFFNPALAIFAGGMLLHQPTLLDILPMYAIFILFIPLSIRYFSKGYHWHVLSISFLLYLTGTFDLAPMPFAEQISELNINTGFFDILAWQFLFIAGLFLGFMYHQGKTEQLQTSKVLLWIAISISVPLFVAKFFFSDHLYAHYQSFVVYWTDKEQLRPLRLLNFTAVSIIVTFIGSKYGHWFTFKPLILLGKHSLEVFAFHIVLVMLFKPLESYLNNFFAIKVNSFYSIHPLGTLLTVVMVLALFLAPLYKAQKKAVPKLKEVA